jgi:hypothetical protein
VAAVDAALAWLEAEIAANTHGAPQALEWNQYLSFAAKDRALAGAATSAPGTPARDIRDGGGMTLEQRLQVYGNDHGNALSDYSTSWENIGDAQSTTVFGAAKAGTLPVATDFEKTDEGIAENVILAAIIGDGDSART